MNTIAQKYSVEKIFYRTLQLFLFFSGISFFFWAFSDPRFGDAEGFLKGKFCLPMAVGLALIILGCMMVGKFKKFGFWFVLALVGQAVALQMIDAGHLIRYQHYRPLGLLAETDPLLLIYLALQTSFVVVGLIRRRQKIRTWLSHTFKTWQLLGLGLIFAVSSAAVQRNITLYLGDLFIATLVQVVNLGNIVLMVWAFPEKIPPMLKQRLNRLFGTSGKAPSFNQGKEENNKPKALDLFSIFAAVWVTLLAAVLNIFSYERHPHVPDEIIYLYHARYFAESMLTVPAPTVPEAFSFYLIPYKSDAWYSIFPPGWPAILAIGVLAGFPWLVNPVLAGVNILLTYILIQEFCDRRYARLTLFLLCVSPWYIFMGMNFMAHTLTLTCTLVASLALVWARKNKRAGWGFLGGCAVGMVSLVRPLDGLIVAGLLGLWAIGLGGQRLKASSLLAFIVGIMMIGAIILPYNKYITGDSLTSPLMAYYNEYYGPGTNALGFGPNRGLGWPLDAFPGHSPLEAMINANLNIFSVNIELFGWSTGSFVMMAFLILIGKLKRGDYLLIAIIITIFSVYSFYWFSGGPDFGARYWFLMLVPCVALTAKGIQFLEKILESSLINYTDQSARFRIAILSLCGITLINYLPWRAIDKYHHYLRMRPDIRYIAKDYDFGRGLVLINGESHPDYASAAIYNPLDLRAEATIYAWDRDPAVRARLLKAYPDRLVWIVNGPSITNDGYKVIKGPIPAQKLIDELSKEPGL